MFITEVMMFHINQKFNLAIKRLTMYLQYHGLSRLGIQMLSFKGICVNPRTADRTTSTRIRMQSSMVAALIHEGRAIIGIDNYNHAWGSPIVSPERQSQLVLANYTTCGVSKYQVHVDLRRSDEGVSHLRPASHRLLRLRQLTTREFDVFTIEVGEVFALHLDRRMPDI